MSAPLPDTTETPELESTPEDFVTGELERKSPYEALRSSNYRRFAAGFLASSTGLQMLGTAIHLEIYDRTHDPLALGYSGLARALPVVLLALPAGHASDLYDRRKIIIVSQAAYALCAAALAVVSIFNAPVWVFYVMLALSGVARACNGPARGALLPSIIEPEFFQSAVAWNSGVFQFAAVAGPLLAGVMMWAMGQYFPIHGKFWPVYLFTALGTVFLAAMVYTIKPVREAPKAAGRFTPASMLAGMGYVYREKTIFGAITLDLFAVLLGGATALMPVYAKNVLNTNEIGLGALRAAPFVGAFLMAVYVAHRPPFRRAGAALLWSVGGFGVATVIFGISTNLWVSLGALFLLGALDNISVVVRHVLVQVRTPDELRGRVGAVNSLFIEMSNELGAFESGAVAKLFQTAGPVAVAGLVGVMPSALGPLAVPMGAAMSVVTGGLGTVAVVCVVAVALPELRRLGKLGDPRS